MQDVLLIIDLQNGVCQTNDQTIDHLSELLLFVNQRIQRYRKEEKPVIFVQHEEETLPYGSKAWQPHPALAYEPTDRLIRKKHANSFFQTDLQAVLQTNQVRSIEFAGAQTEYCLDGTIKFAHGLGYQNVVYAQATTTYPSRGRSAAEIIDWYEMIWQGRFAEVLANPQMKKL